MTEKTGIFYQPMVPPENAECIVLGLPFDGTVTGRPGARFGPRAIRDATLNAEDYSPYLERDISDIAIADYGDVDCSHGDTGAVLKSIKSEYAKLTETGGKMVALGGEHLVTLPLFEVLYAKYGERLFVIQFDAHADLREDYLGVRLSHAAVMNHIAGTAGIDSVAVVGVRSGSREEWKILHEHPHFFSGIAPIDIGSFERFVSETLAGRALYVTVDLDVFDPSAMPGTGTPEPGGMFFDEFMELAKCLACTNIVGADIVELAPDYDHSGISSSLAATVLRELLLLMTG